ncbi:sugar transferase [Lachnospiraceae bacterium 48-21]
MKRKSKKKFIISMAVVLSAWAGLNMFAKTTQEGKEIDEGNPYLDTFGIHIMELHPENSAFTFYEKYGKRILDRALSFISLIVLMPIYIIIAFAIYRDDPGNILFTQKRVGKDKHFIYVHKFRTMRMDAPHDVPTHQFTNPEQYITKVGKFLRKYSLDELPQMWDIFRGKMSIIGPRPALWNQEDLVAEREKYNANTVMPGLTGWAQINGRDELRINDKARLDGEYCRHLRGKGLRGLCFDIRCFLGTIKSVIESDGVVEGGRRI